MHNQIHTSDDVKQLGTILTVWAHPDDETFCAGGIIAAAINNGQKVICITATRGEAGVQDETRWPAAKLADIREHEMEAALKVLGITNHYWLDYHDGDCYKISDEEGSAKIKEFIETHQPDTILTFGPEGLTGHPDHQAVSRWVSLATKGTKVKVYHKVEDEELFRKYMEPMHKQFNIYFNIDRPPVRPAASCDIAFSLTPELMEQKRTALKEMPSQTEAMLKHTPKDSMEAAVAMECFVQAP